MKLDYDVLTNALSFIDAAKERCLDLRNLKIARIENLAMTRDLNDTIDLTNNELVVLADFPLLPRLHTLLLSHNRITQIAPTVAPALPNLTNLILSNNQIAELDDLAGLFAFKNLVRAAFVGCPVSAKKNYRLYVISRCKNIRVLDFRRVKDLERAKAKELFSSSTTADVDVSSASVFTPGEIDLDKHNAVDTPTAGNSSSSSAPAVADPAEAARIRAAIEAATSLDEVARLKRQLEGGSVPPSAKRRP